MRFHVGIERVSLATVEIHADSFQEAREAALNGEGEILAEDLVHVSFVDAMEVPDPREFHGR